VVPINRPCVESEPSVKHQLLLILAMAASIDAAANRATRRSQKAASKAEPVARSDRFVGPSGAAEILGCDVRTVYNALNDGRLKGYKFGRTVRIRLSDIESALTLYGGADGTSN
jgi:excisionase family DNA binding protein